MEIRFLGSGYGICKIKKKYSKEHRRASSVLIDERILIDPTEQIFEFEDHYSLDGLYKKVEAVLITHAHEKHFSIETLQKLAEKKPIAVYASARVLKQLPEQEGIIPNPVKPLSLYEIAGYKVIPLPAAHASGIPSDISLHYAISREKSILWAVPGGFLRYETWQLLSRLKLDAIILDCALGVDHEISPECYEHLSVRAAISERDVLLSAGVIDERSRTILAHLPTDKKREIHEEVLAQLEGTGISAAYDGFFLRI